MTTITQAVFAQRVAKYLLVQGVGDSLNADIDSDIDRAITDVFEELEVEGLAHWELTAIPLFVVHGFKLMVAGEAGPGLGVFTEEKGEALRAEGLANLRRVLGRPYSGKRTKAVYY